ncbi:hypothetical protein ACFQZS_00330 [Mucilaginibacter calamicampi]|uniref:Uncharacterized protein n=1 Tax=Mucilaginibacter calamicampi TaxID=1302352 RepID=A0ABW2YVI6_9SPHI
MRQKDVFNKIGVILKELNDQYKYLEVNPDDMNSLELELFVANAHFLTDHAEILNKLNLQIINTKPALPPAKEEPKKEELKKEEPKKEEPISEEKYFEPVVRQPSKKQSAANNKAEELPVVNFEIEPSAELIADEEPEIIRHELDVEEIPDWDEEETAIEEEPIEEITIEEEEILPADAEPEVVEPVAALPEPVKPTPEPAAPPAEQPKDKDEVLTINQRMSAQLNKGGVTDQPAGQPVTDLKQAISLNDKLLYIKDLFNGYNLAYSEAIEILNRLGSFADAERFLSKNYIAKNNWESKADTVAKFYAVLKRRYL